MSLKPYPEYKDSGFEWLGNIPKMWRLNKFRHVFAESSEVNGPSPVGEMLSISGYRGVELKKYDDENQKRSDGQLETYRVVRAGQLAVNTMWLNYAGLGVSSLEGHVSPAYRAYWIHPSMDRRYVHYLMRSAIFVDGYTANLTGIRPNSLQMSRPALMSFPVIVPPIAEQQTIAAYLDRETAEIDAFIADQEELISLLSERRTATITRAVTKGLNPDVPVKDSGVDWLGEVPEHWTVEKLSWLSRIGNGSTPATENVDYWAGGNIPWLNSSCVNLDVVLEPSKLVTEAALKACHLPMVPAGSVLVGLTGQGKTRGMATMLKINSTINQHIAYVTPSTALNVAYLHWFLAAAYDQLRFISDGNGGTKGGLTCGQLGRIRIPSMSADEQLQIASYLDRETGEINAAIADAREAIALSKERRAAVISAAVTGKIDVRGLVAPATNDVEGVSVGVA